MLILFILFLFECRSSRWDYIQTIYSPSGSSDGSWQTDVYCPSGTWARGYQHRTDPNENSGDDFGTDTVRFFCYDYSGAKVSYIDSNGQNWGTWSNEVTCAGSQNFIIGYQLKNWDASDCSVTGVQIMCSDHQSQNAGHEYPLGTWKAWGICPAGTALCGQLSRWEDAQYCLGTPCYNTALNDLKIYCCRICDEDNARFVNPSTLNCDQCHYTCKTCSGSGISQCKSCYHSDTLTSNSCPGPTYLYEKTFEDPPFGWAGATTTSCGMLTNIVGGYNTFGKGQSITKTFSNLPPFFKTRIRVRYIKIDAWDAETAKLDVNGVNLVNTVINWNDGLLFGDQCGLSNYNEYALMIELETNTNKNVVSFPVKIYSGLGSVCNDEFWGVGDIYLGVLKCDVTCKTCTGPNSNECDGCYPNASLQPDNTCVCDDTYYAVSVSTCTSYPCTTCTPCYTGCKKCSGPNNIDCSSCISYYYLLVNRCYGGYCPSPNCGNNDTWTCDTICASTNQFIDLADRICKPCDSTCLTCSERLSLNCLTCGDPRLHTIGSGDGECVTSCPIPRFAHYPARICQVICPIPTWGRETPSRICSDSCLNANEYKDITDRICKVCNPFCSTCKGSSTSDCLSCSGTRYLYGNQCLTDCLAGKYGKSVTNTCETCNSNCETCETPDQPTKCLSCKVPYYLKSTGNLCVSACLTNEYVDDTDRKCRTCHSDCATCFGGLATNCLTCTGFLYFHEPDNTCITSCPSPFYAYLNLCQKTCPSGLFGKINPSRICEAAPCLSDEFADPADRICRKCHLDCLRCSGLTNTDCLSCGGFLYQKGTTCVINCGTSFYGRKAVNQNTCEACSNNCYTCKTPDGPSYCTSCGKIYSKIYFLYANTCISTCPTPLWGRSETFTCENTCSNTHQFGDPNDNRLCNECPSVCSTCDEFGCLSCSPGLYLYERDCISICPRNQMYWENSLTNTCNNCSINCVVTCHSNCKTCYGPGDNNCNSCANPLVLLNNRCLNECGEGYWVNQTSSGELECLKCDSNFEFLLYKKDCNSLKIPIYFLENNQCVKECPYKKYASYSEKKCIYCPDFCEKCKFPGLICEKCLNGYYFLNGFCYYVCPVPFWGIMNQNNFTCEKVCGARNNFYLDTALRTCSSCHDSCDSCYGPLAKNCLSCHPNFFLSLEGDCQVCDEPCMECLSLGSNCTSCITNTKLFKETENTYTCILSLCEENCAVCNNSRVCITCKSKKYYLNKISDDETNCQEKHNVDVAITEINNPKAFELKFTEFLSDYFKGLSNKTFISISNLDLKNYNCSLIVSTTDPKVFYIFCDYYSNITSKSLLSIKFNDYPADSDFSSHTLLKNHLEIGLSNYKYCGIGRAWNEMISSCYSPTAITPYIRLTYDPQILVYGFDGPVPDELDKNISLNLNITINSLNASQYSTKITKFSESQRFQYQIIIDYQNEINNNPQLQVDLILSPSLKSNELLIITKTSVFINVMNYYALSSESKQTLQISGVVTNSSTSRANQLFFAISVVKSGSSFLIKSMIVNQMLQLMKFVNINYPPNVLEIFKYNLAQSSNFPEFELELEPELRDGIPEESFYRNKLSPYILNNCGTFILSIYGFFLIALALKLVMTYGRGFIQGGTLFIKVYGIIYDRLVWSLPFSLILSKYVTVSVLLGIALRFPTHKTTKGLLNLLFACFTLAVIVSFPILILTTIRKIRLVASYLAISKPSLPTMKSRGSFFLLTQNKQKSIIGSPLTEESDKWDEKEFSGSITNSPELLGNPIRRSLEKESASIAKSNLNEKEEQNSRREGRSKHVVDEINKITFNIEDKFARPEPKSEDNNKTSKQKSVPLKEGEENNVVQSKRSLETQKNPLGKLRSRKPSSLMVSNRISDSSNVIATPVRNVFFNYNKGVKGSKRLLQFFEKKGLDDPSLVILNGKKNSFSDLMKPIKNDSASFKLDILTRNYEVFHKEFKKDRAFSHYFMFFELVRQLLFALIILCIETWPLMQTLLINILNLLFLIVIIKFKPYANKLIFFQNCIGEALLLSSNIGFLTLAILDSQENRNLDARLQIGWWICMSNLSIVIFMLLMVCVLILSNFWNLFRKAIAACMKHRTNRISYA